MPRFEPFQGLRYDGARVALDDVISPPYDIIDAAERAALARRSRYNSVAIELPVADASRGLDRYHHAAALLDSWERDGILLRDEVPSLYGYRMTFVGSGGTERSTTGVIGALGLFDDGGAVLPHEGTFSTMSRDRLELLRACQVNVSPIWCLSLADGLTKVLDSAIESASGHEVARDDEGVVHEAWRIADPVVVAEISALVRPEPFVIADGHHRFETASRYRAERRSLNADSPGDFDYLMTFVVELRPDELDVQPIHRVLSHLPEGSDVASLLGASYRLAELRGDTNELLSAMASEGALGLVTREQLFLLEPISSSDGGPDALDTRFLDHILEALPSHEVSFEHRVDSAIATVRDGRADAAVLVKAASIPQIADAARHKTSMPPKTTFFRPKPRTGFVFRSVEC